MSFFPRAAKVMIAALERGAEMPKDKVNLIISRCELIAYLESLAEFLDDVGADLYYYSANPGEIRTVREQLDAKATELHDIIANLKEEREKEA
jgi:hypothetical protein